MLQREILGWCDTASAKMHYMVAILAEGGRWYYRSRCLSIRHLAHRPQEVEDLDSGQPPCKTCLLLLEDDEKRRMKEVSGATQE